MSLLLLYPSLLLRATWGGEDVVVTAFKPTRWYMCVYT